MTTYTTADGRGWDLGEQYTAGEPPLDTRPLPAPSAVDTVEMRTVEVA